MERRVAPVPGKGEPIRPTRRPGPFQRLAKTAPDKASQVDEFRALARAYERAFFQNPRPVIVYDADNFQILQANRSALRLYGYTKKDMRALGLLDLFARRERDDSGALTKELRKPANTLGPFVHLGMSGRELMVTLVFSTLATRGRNARIVQIQDETARLTAEDKLRTSEERFRELFENANDVIFLHDLKGRVMAINRAAESLSGYTRSEVLNRNFEAMVAPESQHLVQDSIRAHLGGSATQHFELKMISKTGLVRFLDVNTRIIYRRGHAVAIQGIGRDVTERKHAQQRLLESSRQLQVKNEELVTALRLAREATQLKEQFLANTSHELRTPMNGIMGMINVLKGTELTIDQRDYVDAVSACSNDLLTIINDLLDLSQIGAGQRIALDYKPFDPSESLRAVVRMLALRASAKGLRLRYEIFPDVPSSIEGDSVRLRQILTNLIANALKFTITGDVQIRLAAAAGPAIRCEVEDTGIGIDESLHERIFDAFFQADGTNRRRFGGTGLGLTISKQLVELMGGRIGVFSNNGLPGSTFWFELPASQTESIVAEAFSVATAKA